MIILDIIIYPIFGKTSSISSLHLLTTKLTHLSHQLFFLPIQSTDQWLCTYRLFDTPRIHICKNGRAYSLSPFGKKRTSPLFCERWCLAFMFTCSTTKFNHLTEISPQRHIQSPTLPFLVSASLFNIFLLLSIPSSPKNSIIKKNIILSTQPTSKKVPLSIPSNPYNIILGNNIYPYYSLLIQ